MCRTVVILKWGLGQQNEVQVVKEEESEVKLAAVTTNIYTLLAETNPKFLQCLWKQQCQNQNDHWHRRLNWHTWRDCFRTHQSKEQHHTATIVHVFACLQVNQSISSKRAIPKHHLLPKPTMQHTVTCTQERSWVTLQLQNCYCSRNSQPTSELHTRPYSTTREITYKIPYTVPRNGQVERGGGQIIYWWKNKSCHTTEKFHFTSANKWKQSYMGLKKVHM